MSAPTAPAGKLDWLQGLRGLAALLVVLTHGRYFLTGTPGQALGEALLRPGAAGVDLFFLISGFIMVHATAASHGGAGDASRYLLKRFFRIWPVYAVLTAVGVYATRGPGWLFDSGNLGALTQGLLFLPVDGGAPPYYDLPYRLGWTLNFEMYFYLVFAASMRFGRQRWLAFGAWLGVTLIGLPLAYGQAVTLDVRRDYHLPLAYLNQISNPIIWNFVAGVAIGKLYQSRLALPAGVATNNLLFVSVALALWWAYSGGATFHGVNNMGAGPAMVLLCVALASKRMPIVMPRCMVWLGEISFSLYLCHFIVFKLLTSTLVALGMQARTHDWPYVFVATALAIPVAAVSHRYLELGLSGWLRSMALARYERGQASTAAGALGK
ncbi:MAG: acyltransferase [Pseudomonadota bacterium]